MCEAVLEPDVRDFLDAVNRTFLKGKIIDTVFRRSPLWERLTKE